jgi:rubrerythrin
MNTFRSADEILNFAIEREEEAFKFYTDLSNNVKSTHMRQLFSDFAHEELGHKARLMALKKSGTLVPAHKKIPDLKIADYLVEIEPQPVMEYQDALRLAMQREKAAFRLYTDLAIVAEDDTVRSLFLFLAQEEAKHKLHFEIEYDDNVLNED